MFIFYAFLPFVCFPFLRLVEIFSGCFRHIFLFQRQKKRSLVMLDKWSSHTATTVVISYSNDHLGICLGKLSTARLSHLKVTPATKHNFSKCVIC